MCLYISIFYKTIRISSAFQKDQISVNNSLSLCAPSSNICIHLSQLYHKFELVALSGPKQPSRGARGVCDSISRQAVRQRYCHTQGSVLTQSKAVHLVPFWCLQIASRHCQKLKDNFMFLAFCMNCQNKDLLNKFTIPETEICCVNVF